MESTGCEFEIGMVLPAVQLRHDLPDGTSHVDWMIGTDADGQGPLLAFRLPRPVEQLPVGQPVTIERIDQHRSHYLDYEGPISGGRGYVTRLAHGEVTWSRQADGSLVAAMRWRADRDEDVAAHTMTARLIPSENPSTWQLVLTGESVPHRAQ